MMNILSKEQKGFYITEVAVMENGFLSDREILSAEE